MKKRTILAMAAFAVVLGSCHEDDINGNENKGGDGTMSFNATIVSPTTRTALDGKCVTWTTGVDGDEISVNGAIFKASETATISEKLYAVFTGTVSLTAPFKAIFPKELNNYTLPAEQTFKGTNSSYQPIVDHLPMYAESSTYDLKFSNICGVLGVKVKSADMPSVKSIKVSCSNTDMYGAFTVVEGKAVLTSTDNGNRSVVLTCNNAITTADEGTTFYIALPEAKYENLKVELSADGTNYTKTMNARKNNIQIAVNTIYPWNFLPEGYYPLSENPTVSTAL